MRTIMPWGRVTWVTNFLKTCGYSYVEGDFLLHFTGSRSQR